MRLVPPYIETLEPYRPGKPIAELQRELGLTRVVKLASNENPLGPPPAAAAEITRHLHDLHLYPNGGLDLREVLAQKFNLKVGNVIAGSGSEGIMSAIIRAFLCDDDEVLTSDGTFVGFYVLARSRLANRVLSPYLVAAQAVPILALSPLIALWFGTGLVSRSIIVALS